MLLFKYLNPQVLDKVFSRDGEVALRFAFPNDYSDPYELFLQTGLLVSAEHRAFYKYFLGTISNFPVTCFSRRPDSVVMWAHYAREGSGICLGFEEDAVTDQFPVAYVRDVQYTDQPAQIDPNLVMHAATTLKARHSDWLLNLGYGAAYFTKRDDWQYEAERRVVVQEKDLESTEIGLIARLPLQTLRYVILGSRTDGRVKDICRLIAERHAISLLTFKTGKVSYHPFFLGDPTGDALLWSGDDFEVAKDVCASCSEPTVVNEDGECGWCTITSEDAAQAASGSLSVLAANLGIQEISVSFHGAEAKGFKISGRSNKPTS